MVAKSFEKHLSNRHRQLLKPSPLFFRKKKQAAAKLFKIWHLQGTVSVSSMPNG